MRDHRRRLSLDERERASAAASARLLGLPELRAAITSGGCVAGFSATRGEIDPSAALEAARAGGAIVVLPRVASGDSEGPSPAPEAGGGDPRTGGDVPPRLRFHRSAGPGDLRPGRFDILEPAASSPEELVAGAAVMIVPGLAFDESGRRLGSGGGYYDELLRPDGGTRPSFVVGLGYDLQLVDACPAGPDDARVDCVVTDARVIRCTAAGPGDGSRQAGEAGS